MYSFEVDAKCVTSTNGTDAPRPETSVTSGIKEYEGTPSVSMLKVHPLMYAEVDIFVASLKS